MPLGSAPLTQLLVTTSHASCLMRLVPALLLLLSSALCQHGRNACSNLTGVRAGWTHSLLHDCARMLRLQLAACHAVMNWVSVGQHKEYVTRFLLTWQKLCATWQGCSVANTVPYASIWCSGAWQHLLSYRSSLSACAKSQNTAHGLDTRNTAMRPTQHSSNPSTSKLINSVLCVKCCKLLTMQSWVWCQQRAGLHSHRSSTGLLTASAALSDKSWLSLQLPLSVTAAW